MAISKKTRVVAHELRYAGMKMKEARRETET